MYEDNDQTTDMKASAFNFLRRRNTLFMFTVLVVVVVLLIFPLLKPSVSTKPITRGLLNGKHESTTDIKTVLLWTQFFRVSHWVTDDHFKWCPISACRVTEDKTKALESDAILFHERDLQGIQSLPVSRTKKQRWVWLSQETYVVFEADLADYRGVFNWTMTYRRDSDVVLSYGAVRKRAKPLAKTIHDDRIREEAKKRNKLVAIRISNCDTKNTDRMNYVRKLSEFISVDILGACGEPCDSRRNNCNDEYMMQYKFYLSFENCHCTDYITEKFWLPLQFWHNVPIVMGGSSVSDYEAIAPPNSYISVDAFKSPEQLAKYLQTLDENVTMYNDFFKWRITHEYDFPGYCYLCAALHNPTLPAKSYADLEAWYKKDKCSADHPKYV